MRLISYLIHWLRLSQSLPYIIVAEIVTSHRAHFLTLSIIVWALANSYCFVTSHAMLFNLVTNQLAIELFVIFRKTSELFMVNGRVYGRKWYHIWNICRLYRGIRILLLRLFWVFQLAGHLFGVRSRLNRE